MLHIRMLKKRALGKKGTDGKNRKSRINFNPNLHVCSFAYLLVDNNKAYLKSITHLFCSCSLLLCGQGEQFRTVVLKLRYLTHKSPFFNDLCLIIFINWWNSCFRVDNNTQSENHWLRGWERKNFLKEKCQREVYKLNDVCNPLEMT